MSRFRIILAAACLVILPATTADGQTLITELDLTTGIATEDSVTAGAAQLRGFGEIKGLSFNLEGTWGNRSESVTDAFGAAYPYGGRIDLSEA